MAKLQAGQELFQAGEVVPQQGQYVLVDKEGHKQDFMIFLELEIYFLNNLKEMISTSWTKMNQQHQ